MSLLNELTNSTIQNTKKTQLYMNHEIEFSILIPRKVWLFCESWSTHKNVQYNILFKHTAPIQGKKKNMLVISYLSLSNQPPLPPIILIVRRRSYNYRAYARGVLSSIPTVIMCYSPLHINVPPRPHFDIPPPLSSSSAPPPTSRLLTPCYHHL